MKIIKRVGEYEDYSRDKLRESLLRAGASIIVTNQIIKKVERVIHDDMTSGEIYQIAFDLLNKKEKITAMRYSVKRSIIELGPTGFPFEKFIAQLLEAKGYKTVVGITLRGQCIKHEVDVVAYDENELILIEAKFHNTASLKTDTKVALYVKARWDDLKEIPIKLDGKRTMKPTRGLLTTNTDFTTSAIEYARCANMDVISWSYPLKGNLFELVRETGQHPITVITELSKAQIRKLIKNGIVTANQILNNTELLSKVGVTASSSKKIVNEIKEVCAII
jgi:hypothetical protein